MDGGNTFADLQSDTSEDAAPFSMETCEQEDVRQYCLVSSDSTQEDASENIKKAQKRQKKDYNRRHILPATVQGSSWAK